MDGWVDGWVDGCMVHSGTVRVKVVGWLHQLQKGAKSVRAEGG